ncbi:MAG: HNH endonuclease signature motif containing protein [Candidatus Dormibacter sp.]
MHGGETTVSNLVLLCRRHHRMVHEDGWSLRRLANGRWALSRPIAPHARSA